MARKALLIGSETCGLKGVTNDLTAMSDALGHWGFSSVRCEKENASRVGILDAYDRMIGQARADDTVVIYYSGHGSYTADPDAGFGTPSHRTVQLIVPTDYAASTEDDFRGITAAELSVLLARLTERTRNVTVVLDCCHSAHMSRGDGDRVVRRYPRAVPVPMVRAHLDNLRRQGLALDLWRPPGNPYAVRVVACAPEQFACEAANVEGVWMGYLTDALTRSLTELRESKLTVSWATVMDRVRQRVLGIWAGQRPEVEGPAQRVVFETAETDPLGTLPVTRVRDRIRIAGASLFGARPGDEFVVMPDDTSDIDDARKLGDVRVDHVDAQAAYGVLTARVPDVPVPLGARAHLVSTALPALSVRIDEDDPRLTAVARAVAPVPIVRVAQHSETAPVRVKAGLAGLTIHDEFGPLHLPRAADAAGTVLVVGDLKRIAQARALRCLTEEPGLALTTPVSIGLAQVVDGTAVPLPPSGAVLHTGQAICVRVRNDGQETVYVSLLDIGVSARISVLNPSAPSGVRIDPGREYVFGSNDLTGALPGMVVSWPSSVPAETHRTETIVVLVSAEPTDTRVLTQSGVRGARQLSRLESYLRKLSIAGVRDTAPEPGHPVRFAVHMVDFDLVPTPAPPMETAVFQVDDRPDRAAVLWNERMAAQAEVTLYLSDLIVHHNRRFHRADIRLDTLIVTDDDAGHPDFHVHTERFAAISDGQRLALSDELIFGGTARDQLDVAVWVSPAGHAPLDLAARLREALPTVQSGPLGAAALIDTAHRVLEHALGETIGLYRTILLGSERFGLNRPPGDFAIRAQDYSFRCAVTEPSVTEHNASLPGGPSE